MKFCIYILIFCCFLRTEATALNLDSLWSVWNDKGQHDTNRLQAIDDIAYYGYLFSLPDSAFYFAQIQYDFAKSIDNKRWMANAFNIQGISFAIRGDFDQALIYYGKCLQIKKEEGDKKGIANSYNNIGSIYRDQGNFKQAIEYYQKGLKIMQEIGYKRGVAASLVNIGEFYRIQGNYYLALSNFNKSLEILKNIADKRGMAILYLDIGLIYKDQGNYEKALEYHYKSLKIKESIGDKQGMAATYTNIGNIYQFQENYEQALAYYFNSLMIDKEIGDKRGMAIAYNNIGIIYYEQGNYEQALESHQKGLNYRVKTGDKRGMAASYMNIGNIYNHLNNNELATEYYHKSLKICEEIDAKDEMASSCINLGDLSVKLGNYNKALYWGETALILANEVGGVKQIKAVSKLLYDVYKKIDRPVNALKMHELYMEMRDSIMNEENTKALIKQQYKYKYEKKAIADSIKNAEDSKVKDAQLAVERAENNSQKQQAVFLYLGLAVTLLFGGFVFNRLKVVRRQKKLIEKQKQEVEYQKGLVDEKNKDITDSIRYAERIQKALLPSDEELLVLPNAFVFFKPKDIVSGDFYWMQHHNDRLYFAICDCTGHGVPGAFMSMICSSLLDEAVVEKGFTKPNEIFSEVRSGIIHALKQTGKEAEQKDGMDATLVTWNKNGILQFAAAYNPVLLIRNGELQEIKADRQPVGLLFGEQIPFTHHELKLKKGDIIYLSTDGYADQFGGPKGKKFKFSRFKDLLLSIQDKSMNEQKEILEQTLAEWQGEEGQVDDILVMGVKF